MPTIPHVDLQIHGLFSNHRADAANSLADFHRHNEVELNFLARGAAVYNYGGRSIPLPLRSLAVFWGGVSHRLEKWRPDGEIWAISIPLGFFLGWRLPPESFTHPLLSGGFLYDPDPAMSDGDEISVRRWHDDLRQTDPATLAVRRDALLLEVQARLKRFALDANAVPSRPPAANTGAGVVDRMLQHIARNYRESRLTVARIARHAGITESYANDCFRKTCGVPLMRYVNHQRITHAQCLLATTDLKITDIALDAGFGSVSQFYHAFRAETGVSPRDYARSNG